MMTAKEKEKQQYILHIELGHVSKDDQVAR